MGDNGEGGVKKFLKLGDVTYGQPLKLEFSIIIIKKYSTT